MYINRRLHLGRLLAHSWKYFIAMTLFSSGIVALFDYGDWEWMHIPWEVLTMIGMAVAFYVGFKNNSAYDRIWEARKIWGAIVNSSRSWAIMVKDYITDNFAEKAIDKNALHAIHKELVYRQIAWIYALRRQLWVHQRWEHDQPENLKYKKLLKDNFTDKTKAEEMLQYLEKSEVEAMIQKQNSATQLIAKQSERLKELRKQNLINDFYHIEMERMLVDLYTQQGKCERIKNFPLPRQYATSSFLFVIIFIFLMPFGLMTEFHKMGDNMIWLTVPFTILIGWVFWLMELVGEYATNPFEGLPFDIPMTSICRTIEIDLKEMIGETDLPPKVEPFEDILL